MQPKRQTLILEEASRKTSGASKTFLGRVCNLNPILLFTHTPRLHTARNLCMLQANLETPPDCLQYVNRHA
jgi:hypothetical protein